MNDSSDDDRFGTSESAFQAARESHGNSPFVRMGMYVPTRREVRTLPPHDVYVILDLWFFEGPVELIPSDEQVAEVKSVLHERPDAASPEVQEVIALCDDYMRPREAEIAGLLARWVDAAAIPDVMRRPIEELGGRSLLEAADAGEHEAVRAYIESTFDLRRSQP